MKLVDKRFEIELSPIQEEVVKRALGIRIDGNRGTFYSDDYLRRSLQQQSAAQSAVTSVAAKSLPVSAYDYKVLVLGNSITEHGACSYWWGRWGMGASERGKDFVHVLHSLLAAKKQTPLVQALNFFQWEVQAADRDETLALLRSVPLAHYDLIVVQLGENIRDTATLDKDFAQLLQHLQAAYSPKQIVVTGSFWPNEAADNIMKEACQQQPSCSFIGLGEIQQRPEYCAGLGTMVQDEQGGLHRIEHTGVANHPGDRAMQYYAEKIMACTGL